MTIKFNNIYIKDVATVAGKIENSGPISKYFDKTYSDFYMNEKTFEAGEVRMIDDSVSILLKKTNMKKDDIDLFISGDLISPFTNGWSKLRLYVIQASLNQSNPQIPSSPDISKPLLKPPARCRRFPFASWTATTRTAC